MALLILLQDGTTGVRFRIDKQQFTIGRNSDNDVCLDDDLVSKQHAVIEAVMQEDGEIVFDYFIQDQQSTNHTYVNDEKVRLFKLRHDDVIRIGKNLFRFVDDSNDDPKETIQLHKTWIPGVYITKKKNKKKKKKTKSEK